MILAGTAVVVCKELHQQGFRSFDIDIPDINAHVYVRRRQHRL